MSWSRHQVTRIAKRLLNKKRQRHNTMGGVKSFLHAWDRPEAARNRISYEFSVGPFGNINGHGRLNDYSAAILGHLHPDFGGSIEAGVRALVMVMVNELGWVTYSSCEGHRYPCECIAPVPRMIGLLPREPAEIRQMTELLLPAIAASARPWSRIQPRMSIDQLRDGTESFVVVDIVFRRVWGNWDSYFERIDGVYERLVQQCSRS